MDFSLKNIDDKSLSLDDFPEAKGFILIFTCNHCPYAIAYESRLNDLHRRYVDQGFPLIAINPNDPVKYPQDSFENMKVRAAQKGFKFPYLFDETQEVARRFKAERTPHAFVLQKVDGELEMVYQGAIDDNYQDAEQVRRAYVAEVVDQMIGGAKPEYFETLPVGCSIKWI